MADTAGAQNDHILPPVTQAPWRVAPGMTPSHEDGVAWRPEKGGGRHPVGVSALPGAVDFSYVLASHFLHPSSQAPLW